MAVLLPLEANSDKYKMEAKVNRAFGLAVKYFEDILGNGMTNEIDLGRECRYFFRGDFIKVLASNELPDRKRFKSIGYYIINNKPRGSAGEHWLSMIITPDGHVVVWDSFGRDIKTLMPDLWGKYGKWIVVPDRDKEQKITQEDCGARCCAFLAIYDILGREMALML